MNPKHDKNARRRRAEYGLKPIVGGFIRSDGAHVLRYSPSPPRSKYTPHVGLKQKAKLAAT